MPARGFVNTLASGSNDDKERLMFPSQPQIGQYMAIERQELAARIRQAESASPSSKPVRAESARRRWVHRTMLKARLAGLRSRFGMSGIK